MAPGVLPRWNVPRCSPLKPSLDTVISVRLPDHSDSPSEMMSPGRLPTSKTPTVSPSKFSLETVPSMLLVTQTWLPAIATPRGPSPTGNVPIGSPSSETLDTVSSSLFVVQMCSPSKAMARGLRPTGITSACSESTVMRTMVSRPLFATHTYPPAYSVADCRRNSIGAAAMNSPSVVNFRTAKYEPTHSDSPSYAMLFGYCGDGNVARTSPSKLTREIASSSWVATQIASPSKNRSVGFLPTE